MLPCSRPSIVSLSSLNSRRATPQYLALPCASSSLPPFLLFSSSLSYHVNTYPNVLSAVISWMSLETSKKCAKVHCNLSGRCPAS
ncbi:hypothetical protein M440DRAFT_1165550 [Trichoderma longibrachiatum ATCC 18648]|uniref:Uncharacterized protein n=1 Tax=Trichoderma longibrachiatum ATCC 18648 TaxID=983965 RepID=A0A2T4CCI7_TRILO|nr:hypothetical protein M440DRAFT_1165550 [Trichoderma longibrachiatum ATCC 18648]